jgi:Transposase.
MPGYHDLSEFERGVIVNARKTQHLRDRDALGILPYDYFREYRESARTSNLRHRCGRKKIQQERNQQLLKRIVQRDRKATLLLNAEDFSAVPSTSVSVRTIQRNIIDRNFWSRRTTRVPLLTARHKA